MLKIRRSRDRLIFSMGIPILGKDGLYIETGPGRSPNLGLQMSYRGSTKWPVVPEMATKWHAPFWSTVGVTVIVLSRLVHVQTFIPCHSLTTLTAEVSWIFANEISHCVTGVRLLGMGLIMSSRWPGDPMDQALELSHGNGGYFADSVVKCIFFNESFRMYYSNFIGMC